MDAKSGSYIEIVDHTQELILIITVFTLSYLNNCILEMYKYRQMSWVDLLTEMSLLSYSCF